jgi:hypothetical protein
MILLGDLIGFAGLGLAARGLWMIWPALALVVVGVFLLVFGILIAARS